jgi:hypothetical protein
MESRLIKGGKIKWLKMIFSQTNDFKRVKNGNFKKKVVCNPNPRPYCPPDKYHLVFILL